MNRARSERLETLMETKYRVLDDGFVRVVDYMGNDEAVVQAARVSYGTGTISTRSDHGLIRFLMRHQHTTPFEMCEIKFHVRVPMDCWRQWIRHRTANVNEYSTRYSEAIDSAQMTDPAKWRTQSGTNKQGSGEFLSSSDGIELSKREANVLADARAEYDKRLVMGVAREQARKDLPLSTYTEAYWKIDLHNLLHFLKLRMDSHAQSEIRDYAMTIGHVITAAWVPLTWDAFVDSQLEAVSLRREEQIVLELLLDGNDKSATNFAYGAGWFPAGEPGRLYREFKAKIKQMRIPCKPEQLEEGL